MLSDRQFYPLAILLAILMIALALVWPQGLGTRSPGPFGHAMAPKLRVPVNPVKPKAPSLL